MFDLSFNSKINPVPPHPPPGTCQGGFPRWLTCPVYQGPLEKPITCQLLLGNKYVGEYLGLVLKLLSGNTNVTQFLIGRANSSNNLLIYATMQKNESYNEDMIINYSRNVL